VNDQDAIALLRDLCGAYSPSGEEAEAVALLAERAAAAGLSTSIDGAGNFIGERGNGPATVVLLGHIDTVEGFISPTIADGRLQARGAVDAKGPLAAFVAATSRAVIPEGVKVVVIGAVEEEAASSKGARYVCNRYAPTATIIGEPSGTSGITLGYKGRVGLTLVAQQPHAHTAAEGRSIAALAAAWWTRVEEYCDRRNHNHRTFDRLDPHLAEFHTSTDGFTDRVDVRGSLRLPPEADVDELHRRVAELAANWGDASLSGHLPAFRSDRKTKLVGAMIRAIREDSREPTFKLKTGTSDMNVVGPVWQCPIVAYGPGDSRLDHAPDEHIVLDEYLAAVRVLTRTIVSRLG
jgi:LysW-gamma-L-lysine carboxypeptidase|tara:strand:- start:3236 stop:4285 length:1050 start_codon:yes stop_codon:yes gene_type:complete